MRGRWSGTALLAVLGLYAMSGSLTAQSIMQDQPPAASAAPQPSAKPTRRAAPPTSAFEQDPDLDVRDQLAPSQINQPMPAAVPEPSQTATHSKLSTHAAEPTATASAAAKPPRTAAPRAIACNGVFGRESNHAKLAAAFQAKNIADTEVESGSGQKVTASVLFAQDPKRRLEVWWSDPTGRSDIHLIVVNGESAWAAPGGLRLGLTLAELEKLNHRPFKVTGFDKTKVASLSDWNGGELAFLAGGCKIGISLRAGPNANALALSVLSSSGVFTSADAVMRAANPTVSEILVAY